MAMKTRRSPLPPVFPTWGESLFIDRRRCEETQAKCARKFGVGRKTYQSWERSAEPRTRTVNRKVHRLYPHEYLTLLRRRTGFTQGYVAQELGVSTMWVARMELGTAPCKPLRAYWETLYANLETAHAHNG